MIDLFLHIKDRLFIRIRLFLFLLLGITAFNFVYSQNMLVPENIQAALLPKVLKFNTSFATKRKELLSIVHNEYPEQVKIILKKHDNRNCLERQKPKLTNINVLKNGG